MAISGLTRQFCRPKGASAESCPRPGDRPWNFGRFSSVGSPAVTRSLCTAFLSFQIMGLLALLVGSLNEQLSTRSFGVIVAAGFLSFFVLAIVLNVLSQLLFKIPNEPPLVFHWVPFFGNTIVYGVDPYKFFFGCREKVGTAWGRICSQADKWTVW